MHGEATEKQIYQTLMRIENLAKIGFNASVVRGMGFELETREEFSRKFPLFLVFSRKVVWR